MSVVVVPGTPYAEEIRKWEYADFKIGDDPGLRGPRVYQEFPKMLYKAGRNERNQIALIGREIAEDAEHERRLNSRGFVFGPAEAIEEAERQEREVAKLAANRAYQERTMSESARAEAEAYDASVSGHVAEIPEAPKKRGRPRKDAE